MNRSAATALGGIAYIVSTGVFFAALDTTTQFVAMSVPVFMVLWVRYVSQALLSTLLLAPLHGRLLLRTRHPRLQLLRGMLLVSSTVLAIFSLKYMPVGEFTAIVMVTPLAVTVLSATLFKERIAPLHWLCVFGGFVGTLAIARPGSSGLGWAALLPIGCMAISSVFQLLSSHLGKTELPAATHLWSVWTGAIVSTLALPLTWVAVESTRTWALMLLMGAMGAAGHFSLTLAYQRASAAVLMPYLYVNVGFAVAGGWLVFAHVPDGWARAGIALVAVCGVGAAMLTRAQHRTASRMPEP